MLVSFRFKNCRSFYNEAELSMRATTDTSYKDLNTFCVNEKTMSKGDNEFIKSAIIFGGNASGKSTLVSQIGLAAITEGFKVAMFSGEISAPPLSGRNMLSSSRCISRRHTGG